MTNPTTHFDPTQIKPPKPPKPAKPPKLEATQPSDELSKRDNAIAMHREISLSDTPPFNPYV